MAALRLKNRTSSQIFRRASELNLIRRRERVRWSEEEEAVVEAFAHLSPEIIQKKLSGVTAPHIKRTRSAICSLIHALHLRSNLDGWSKSRLGEAFGVSVYQIDRWTAQGLLRASKLPSLDQHAGRKKSEPVIWHYRREDVIRFALAHPLLFDFRKVNQRWFMEILTSVVRKEFAP